MYSIKFSDLSNRQKPRLSDGELNELLIKAREDSDSREGAIEDILYSNLGLIFKTVKKFSSYITPTFDLDDLQSEAIFGFIKAILLYDPAKGYRFSTYVTVSMKYQIYRAHEKTATPLRLAGHIQRAQYKVLKELNNFVLENNNPDQKISYLIQKTGFSKEKIEKILTLPKVVFSMEDVTNFETESTFGDLISDERNDLLEVETEIDRIRLLKFLKKKLNSKEYRVFYYHYGFNDSDNEVKKYDDTGKILGVPGLQVKKIHNSGLNKLKKPENRKILSMLLTGNGRYK